MRNHKSIILSILLLSLALGQVLAQGHRSRREDMEKFKAMRIAFYTENLQLSQEQAEKFWPVYNAHHSKRDKLMRERWIRQKKMHHYLDTLSEGEAGKILDQHVAVMQEVTRMDMQLQEDLLEFLPPSKVVNLYVTEIRFREHMLRTLREERKQGQKDRQR